MFEQEQWCNINGYEDIYQISDKGRIKNITTNKFLKTRLSPQGFWVVNLYNEHKEPKLHTVHRVVAEHFVKWTGKRVVTFLDGDRNNICSDNLSW